MTGAIDPRAPEGAGARPVAPDRALRGARLLQDPRLLFEALVPGDAMAGTIEVTVLKHKPGRRIAARVTCGRRDFLVKAFANDRGARIAHRTALVATALACEGGWSPVAAPLAYLARDRAIVYPWREGTPLPRAAREGDARSLGARTGAAIVALHALGDGALASEFAAWSWEDEARTLLERSAALLTAVSDRRRTGALRVRLARAITLLPACEPPALLHRDLYPEQVIASGRAVQLLDLDDCALGSPWIDVANFLAHVELGILREPEEEAPLRGLAAGFLGAWPSPPPEDVLRTLVVGSLVRLAGLAVTRRGDPGEAERLLSLAERRFPPG